MSMTLTTKLLTPELRAIIDSYTGPIQTAKPKKVKRYFVGFSNGAVFNGASHAQRPYTGR